MTLYIEYLKGHRRVWKKSLACLPLFHVSRSSIFFTRSSIFTSSSSSTFVSGNECARARARARVCVCVCVCVCARARVCVYVENLVPKIYARVRIQAVEWIDVIDYTSFSVALGLLHASTVPVHGIITTRIHGTATTVWATRQHSASVPQRPGPAQQPTSWMSSVIMVHKKDNKSAPRKGGNWI